ncbi:MAG: DUF484 family protein [Betaproteobacteria bacterium]|nr:DUF484 family protein [Betaproteobacteria bacterium]
MNIDEIAAFLKANPDFFAAYPDVLLDINLPHPHGGRAVSIPERQLIATREKVKLLESKLAELIEFGVENDKLSTRIHALTLRLIDCAGFDQLIDTLYLDLLDNFQVPHVAVRLWSVIPPAASASAPEFQPVPVELQQFVEAMTNPYCGGHPVYETHLWFGEHAPHLKSYAMLPLKGERTIGLLLLASESAERFYADMGTQFLTRIGEILAHCLARQLVAAAPASTGTPT